LTVNNHSNQPATGVVVRDTLPPGLTVTGTAAGAVVTGNVVQFRALTLAAGATQTLTLTAQVAPRFAPGAASVTNTATVADAGAAASLASTATVADDGAIGPDANPADNTAADSDALDLPAVNPTAVAQAVVVAPAPTPVTVGGGDPATSAFVSHLYNDVLGRA